MSPRDSESSAPWQYRMTPGESFRWRHAAARGDQERMARELVFRVAEQAQRHGADEFVIRDCNGAPLIHGACRAQRGGQFDSSRYRQLYSPN